VPDTLRIGFVTTHAAQDRAAYSGTAFAMRQALLARADVAVIDIDGLSTVLYPLWRAKQAAYWFGFGKRYWMNRESAVLSGYARQVARRVAADEPIDVLLSPGSVPLCHYTGPVPTVFWSDATFDCLVDFYPEATGFSRETIAAGHRMEQAALRNCTLAIYSSDWARQSAADVYRAPAKKLETVPYGANIDPPTGPADAEGFIASRAGRTPRLLFVANDWQRKGGDLAVAVAAELVRRGRPVDLDVVGCGPPGPVPPFVTVHGFLDKGSPVDRARLAALFRAAHALVLPTRADCVPMVIAEAYAYALPAAVTAVGGIFGVVDDGVTGRLLPPEADAAAWATAVEGMLWPEDRHVAMSRAALDLFRRSLNWPTAVQRVVGLLRARCVSSRAA
jgi:glycosyltransferase involved in cell wall biosynthesis